MSTDHQSYSPVNQADADENYAKTRGIEIIVTYYDPGISGLHLKGRNALQQLIQRSLPGTHITVDTIGSNVALGGIAMNPLEAKQAEDLANEYISTSSFFTAGGKVVNTMKIAGEDQVMLQVKMVEVQRDVLKQWGINFGAIIKLGAFAFNLSSVNPFSTNLSSSILPSAS